MAKQGGLGRGLASLIPQKGKKVIQNSQNYLESDLPAGMDEGRSTGQTAALAEKKGFDLALKSIAEIPAEKIKANPYQPRKHFNEEKLQELAASIKEHGVLQPLVVSRLGNDQYELIAGERRLEASKIAGLEKVPAVIKEVNDQQKLEMAIIENIQRHNLNPIEEARAYKKLQDMAGMTQDEIAQRVGKSRSAVANTLRLLSLPIEIQKALEEGKITEGHARLILAVSGNEKQRALFELILKNELSVRETEHKIREVGVVSHKRKLRAKDPEIAAKENWLEKQLGTKVRIKKTKGGGQILIDFYSEEELENILGKIVSQAAPLADEALEE